MRRQGNWGDVVLRVGPCEFDVSRREALALVRPAGDVWGRGITLVLNWLTELQRLPRQ